MILERSCGRTSGKGHKEKRDGATQQFKRFVPVGNESFLHYGGQMEVGTVCCYECEGIWEGENITFDEIEGSDYFRDENNETKDKRIRGMGTDQ
jgi:hypothetical protein